MPLFDRNRLSLARLRERESKTSIEASAADPDAPPPAFAGDRRVLEGLARAMLRAKEAGGARIVAFGAHTIKNGLGPVLRRLVEEDYVTHLATNGAGSIHDWEFAYLGRTEEDVRRYAAEGRFGLWDETGRYINLAVLVGAAAGRGYGESVGRMIHDDGLDIPEPGDLARGIQEKIAKHAGHKPDSPPLGGLADLWEFLRETADRYGVRPGRLEVCHPFKRYSIQEAAYARGVPFTVHPGLGYDIIHASPFCRFATIGRAAELDFLRFVGSVAQLSGGVYISIGSAIMSPMVFEKSLSMARNVARQEEREIADFTLVVNDIQDGGNWEWGSGREPGKDNPAYYLRFCKTFDRMGAREMHYVQADNRAFLLNLYAALRTNDG